MIVDLLLGNVEMECAGSADVEAGKRQTRARTQNWTMSWEAVMTEMSVNKGEARTGEGGETSKKVGGEEEGGRDPTAVLREK